MAEPAVVHRLTQAEIDGTAANPKLGVNLTQGAVAKGVFAMILAAVAFYYLHTGRRYNEPGRLMWAAVFGGLTLLALCL